MAGLTKSGLVDALFKRTGVPKKDVLALLEVLNETVAAALVSGDKVKLAGISIRPVTRKERKGRNLRTGEEVVIPERIALSASPSKSLDGMLNG